MNLAGALLRRVALAALLFSLAGCSGVKESVSGWFGGSNGKDAGVAVDRKATGNKVAAAPAYGTPATTVTAAASGGAQLSGAVPQQASATAGSLLVNTSPSRAKVYLDGVYGGRSPLSLVAEPGERMIAVKLEGYKMVTGKVLVRKGENVKVEITLEQ